MELGFAIIGLGALFGLCLASRSQTDDKDEPRIIDRSSEYDGEYDDIP